MKNIKIINLGKEGALNNSFILVTEDKKVLFAETVNYSGLSTKQEIKEHLSQVSGIDIVDFSMSFDWVGGRPNDRK